jgi:hypothetical protein
MALETVSNSTATSGTPETSKTPKKIAKATLKGAVRAIGIATHKVKNLTSHVSNHDLHRLVENERVPPAAPPPPAPSTKHGGSD